MLPHFALPTAPARPLWPAPARPNVGRQAAEQLPALASPAPPLYRHDGQPVIWPGTVNLIHGPTGTHKSRVAGLLASLALATQAGQALRADALGFSFHPAPGEQYRLLVVDTAHPLTVARPGLLRGLTGRAGYPAIGWPAALRCTSLLATPRAARLTALAGFLAHCRHGFTGHLLLVLDGLNDCRLAECSLSAGIAQLQGLAEQYGATVLATAYPRYQERATWGRAITVLRLAQQQAAGPNGLLQLRLTGRAPVAPLTFYATYCPSARGLVRVAGYLPAPTA